MATKIESTEITQPKKVFVKSEEALDEMEANGQLEPFTDYYTDDELDAPFMPVGSIFVSAIPQTDARVHLLDGSTISQDGIYADFANLIKSLVATGNNIAYNTNEKFDSDVSTYGQCGKFVVDNTAKTIRLPRITEFIASNNGGQTIGLAQLDEFKSHNHAYYGWATVTDGSGSYPVAGDSQASTNTSHTTRDRGGSETRPKNIRYPYYIVLAKGYKSSQVVDVDNIMNEVNAKLSLAGGTMSGEIAIGQGDGKGIQLGKNGRINGTTDDGSTTATILGLNDDENSAIVGHSSFNLLIRGLATRPTYNGNSLALFKDFNVKHGYKTFNSSYCTGTCNWFRVGQAVFVVFQDVVFTANPPDQTVNILTSALPKNIVNTLFFLTPHTTTKGNARLAITTNGHVVDWWANLSLNENYAGFIGYVAQDGE